MEEQDIIDMLQILGCRKIKSLGRNVLATCPFEKHHANGKDDNPGFTFEITPPGVKSRWNCFACGERGLSAGSFAYKVKELLGVDLSVPQSEGDKEYNPKLKLSHDWAPKRDAWWKPAKPLHLKFENFQGYYEEFPQYAVDRGVTPEQVKRWQLGWASYRKRLFIPTFDHEGVFVGYTQRSSDPDDKPKYRHCTGFTKENFLYGEHLWDLEKDTLCLAEGFFEVWKMEQAGLPNPTAFFGTGVGENQVYKIFKHFKKVVIFPDNDKPAKVKREGKEVWEKPGERMAHEWKAALEKVGVEVILAPVLRGKKDVDEWSIREIQYVWQRIASD